MTDVIITALISGLCVAVPSIVATVMSNSKHQELIEYKIGQLEQKVDKHNNVIERTYTLEHAVEALEDQVHDLSDRLKGAHI